MPAEPLARVTIERRDRQGRVNGSPSGWASVNPRHRRSGQRGFGHPGGHRGHLQLPGRGVGRRRCGRSRIGGRQRRAGPRSGRATPVTGPSAPRVLVEAQAPTRGDVRVVVSVLVAGGGGGGDGVYHQGGSGGGAAGASGTDFPGRGSREHVWSQWRNGRHHRSTPVARRWRGRWRRARRSRWVRWMGQGGRSSSLVGCLVTRWVPSQSGAVRPGRAPPSSVPFHPRGTDQPDASDAGQHDPLVNAAR